MHLLKNLRSGNVACVSDQQAGIFLESADRDGRLIPHVPYVDADVGVPFFDEDRAVWLLFPMGPSTSDEIVLFDQDGNNG